MDKDVRPMLIRTVRVHATGEYDRSPPVRSISCVGSRWRVLIGVVVAIIAVAGAVVVVVLRGNASTPFIFSPVRRAAAHGRGDRRALGCGARRFLIHRRHHEPQQDAVCDELASIGGRVGLCSNLCGR
jgi:hypothetical protein